MARKRKILELEGEEGREIRFQDYYLDCSAHPQEISDYQYYGEVKNCNDSEIYLRARRNFQYLAI